MIVDVLSYALKGGILTSLAGFVFTAFAQGGASIPAPPIANDPLSWAFMAVVAVVLLACIYLIKKVAIDGQETLTKVAGSIDRLSGVVEAFLQNERESRKN